MGQVETINISTNFNGQRCLVAVPVSFEVLISLLKPNSPPLPWLQGMCIEGLPPTAVYVSSYTVEVRQEAYLVFYDPSFAPVADGHEIPIFYPKFSRISSLQALIPLNSNPRVKASLSRCLRECRAARDHPHGFLPADIQKPKASRKRKGRPQPEVVQRE